MAPRPVWKGYLKLSLVSCSVAMYTATSTSSRTRLNIINRETGNRIRNQAVDSETGDVVETEDKVKGYEDHGKYVLLEEDELDEVALESTHTIDIDQFVPREAVDEIYLDESFYIVPNEEVAYEAFAVIREAMRKKGWVGLGRVVTHRRERLLMLQSRGKGILATALRYKNEVRDEADYFDDIPDVKVPPDMIKLAEHILEQKKGQFDPGKFEDRYEDALQALIKAKRAGKEPPAAPTPKPSNVINLMDALRRSVKGEKSGGSATRAKSSGRRTATAKKKTAKQKRLKRAS
ncbi:MAG: end-binding protein Ku [Hyphomicrobiales bacterium]|jgi:DNA end-binding protein Ku|nr:end-binding protein Ku [Hyphomicrobiales bacterium]